MSNPEPVEDLDEQSRRAEIGRRASLRAEKERGDRWLRVGAGIHAFTAFVLGTTLLGQLSDDPGIVFPLWYKAALAASAFLAAFSAAWSWFENRSPLLVMLLASLAVVTTLALAGFFVSPVFLANVAVLVGAVRGMLRK